MEVSTGTIHLTAENGLELLIVSLPFVDLVAVIEKFFDAEHITMIGNSHATHSIVDGFIHQFRNGSLSVKDAVLGMYV